jgi:uncharacterized protein
VGTTAGAQLIIRVKARVIYPNCPRYIPKMKLVDVPRDGTPSCGGWRAEELSNF